jgi:hypothetical protein
MTRKYIDYRMLQNIYVNSCFVDESLNLHTLNKTACSQSARLGFEALTGGLDMMQTTKPKFFIKTDEVVQPELMDKPSVTYVSLTNDASDLFADDSGTDSWCCSAPVSWSGQQR